MQDIFHAILLGIIEGLTEFLPISSTGHLIVSSELLGFKDAAKIFTVIVQLGAILAVVWYYRKDLVERIVGLFGWKQNAVKFALNIIIATIPAGIFGLLFSDTIESKAGSSIVALALIVGGIILLIVDRKPAGHAENLRLDDISPKQAAIVGLAQTVALIPGVSRSGASIVGGLGVGLNRVTATALSFYLGIPIIGLASVYKIATDFSQINSVSGGWPALIIGTIVSFFTALLAVTWLLKYISTHNFRVFAWYRIALGAIILAFLR